MIIDSYFSASVARLYQGGVDSSVYLSVECVCAHACTQVLYAYKIVIFIKSACCDQIMVVCVGVCVYA